MALQGKPLGAGSSVPVPERDTYFGRGKAPVGYPKPARGGRGNVKLCGERPGLLEHEQNP